MINQFNYLDKPYNKLTRDEIKKGIVGKYNNLARFCRIAKEDSYELHRLFKAKETPENKKAIKEIYKKAKELSNTCVKGELCNELTLELITALENKYKYIVKFCEKYPEFSNVWISKVFHGDIKKITPKVQKLAKKLDVKIS